MKRDHLDHTGSRSARPRFIPGVYNYCDHWCDRCRFQPRCRLFRDMERYRRVERVGVGALSAAAMDLDDDLDDEVDDADASPRERAEFLAFLDEVNKPISPEEMSRLTAIEERRRALKDAHPLSVAAREYADIAHSLVEVLRGVLVSRADPVVVAALDTIDRFDYFLAVKTWRATGGLITLRRPGEADDADIEEDGNGPNDLQSDANGCAKLVRLVIAESREAWQVLMQVGLATADGVPAAMVRRLGELDAAVGAAFPRAMEFVRPGFDDGG